MHHLSDMNYMYFVVNTNHINSPVIYNSSCLAILSNFSIWEFSQSCIFSIVLSSGRYTTIDTGMSVYITEYQIQSTDIFIFESEKYEMLTSGQNRHDEKLNIFSLITYCENLGENRQFVTETEVNTVHNSKLIIHD